MTTITTVLQIVAPVFILAAIGWIWVRAGFEFRIRFVTRMAMTLSLPCLVFTALQGAEIAPRAFSAVSLATVAGYGAITLTMAGLIALTGLKARTFLAPMIFGNTGNLGLPLALFAFGEEGLAYAVVIFALMAVYSFSAGVWLVSGGGSPVKAMKEPIVWAAILGTVFLWNGWQAPVVVTNTLQLIGQMAIPLMLITLGAAVARLAPGAMVRPMILSVAKLVISAAIAWVVGVWAGLSPVAFGVLVLQLATPVAVTSYLLAEKYQADAETVAGLVVASTLVSVIALPLILAVVI